jgi:hypothetical protein
MISCIGGVLAVGFSPSNLVFNIPIGKQECQTITLISDSETITVSDVWAKDKTIEWKVSSFDTSASDHGLSISYPKTLSLNERQVQVCLSGTEAGEFHGVVLLAEEQKGSSVIQMGIWVKALIGNENQIAEANARQEITTNNQLTTNQTINQSNQLAASNTNVESSGTVVVNSENKNPFNLITGAVIGTNGSINWLTILIILIVVVILAITIMIFRRKRKPEWEKKFY